MYIRIVVPLCPAPFCPIEADTAVGDTAIMQKLKGDKLSESIEYEGSWFRIAHLSPNTDYLPSGAGAALFKLTSNGDNLHMIEYYESNGTCFGPIYGDWTLQPSGVLIRVHEANDNTNELLVKAIFHEYSGEDNREMNLVLYGCHMVGGDGQCMDGQLMASILSNSRHPQTLALFKSAKHLEDYACIDILRLKMLNTYSDCGDHLVDEHQKLMNARVDPEGEIIEKECKVENFPKQTISTFFDEPRVMTVIALIDQTLDKEDISHISCFFKTPNQADCEYIRHNQCYKSQLKQKMIDEYNVESKMVVQLKNNSLLSIDLSGTILWHNGDECIVQHCTEINEDGTCDRYRIFVWSDEDLMDQPTIHTIYDQLDEICADPTDLIFLNTFGSCESAEGMKSPHIACGPMVGWTLADLQLLQGVWFFAADVNANPKIFLQSTVIELLRTDRNDTLEIRFYAQRKSDLQCVGPGNGTVHFSAHNSTIFVNVRYHYDSLPELRNQNIGFQNQILYVDNQRLLLYWCFKRSLNGSCLQYDADILVRSRHLAYHDMALLKPYLDMACVPSEQLRWFDLHSHCGFEMSQTSKLRRSIMTLTHHEVLNILTNVQEPRCSSKQIVGMKVDFQTLEKMGKWFLMAHYDRFEFITFGLIGRLKLVEADKAIIKLYQSAARPGSHKKCYKRMVIITEHPNGDDYVYHLNFKSLVGAKSLSKHIGVVYSCLSNSQTGHCNDPIIYFLSSHQSIDHTELTVLKRVANTVCIPVEHLVHASVYDECIDSNYDIKFAIPSHTNISSSIRTPSGAAILKKIKQRFKNNTYFAVASSVPNQQPFVLRFYSGNAKKIDQSDDLKCIQRNVSLNVVLDDEHLVILNDNELVLLSSHGETSTTVQQLVQYSDNYPTIYPIKYPNGIGTDIGCQFIKKPNCDGSTKNDFKHWQITGVWVLQKASHRFVANMRCTITNTSDDLRKNVICESESISGLCNQRENSTMYLQTDGQYSIEYSNDIPMYPNSEITPNGRIALVPGGYAVLLGACRQNCVLPVERRISIWSRADVQPDTIDTQLKLDNFCTLVDELEEAHTGGNECW